MSRYVAILAAFFGGLGLGPAAPGVTQNEANWWPGPVRLFADFDGRPDELSALGPLWSEKIGDTQEVLSFRPFWTRIRETERGAVSYHLLYPLFNAYRYEGHSHWHILNLIRGGEWNEGTEGRFQLWPFFFWEDRAGEDEDELALWPIGGTLRNFLGRDSLEFWAWPLYVHSRRRGEERYGTPWPFVQWRKGAASGFALWPLFGHFERAGDYDRTFALWPLYYDHREDLERETPTRRLGILPFYSRETGDGLRSETFIWPFFGYTSESAPRPAYEEIRYFWPLLVQGRGEERYKNRWMPFYTHERKGEAEKWWYLWPLLKREEIDLGFLTRHRTQLLYFIFRDEYQTDGLDFQARKQTLWPLYSYWDNGNGRRQIQALDLFTVFFPRNQRVAETWTPLFALYRFDEYPNSRRRSWLWNLVVVEDSADSHRLAVGPLYEHERAPGYAAWRILHGLVGRSEYHGRAQWTVLWQKPAEDEQP